MLRLYVEFKGSGKTPEQWLEQQELSWLNERQTQKKLPQ
jgi:hypothetical protein